MRQHSEETFQYEVLKFLRAALDRDTVYFHVPNGGYRRFNEAKRLKALGVVAGIPDIGIVHMGRIIWLELKGPKGRATDAQLYTHARLRRAASPVSICKTLDDVAVALNEAGVPLHARIAA